jgi:hypothetical protein
MTNLFPKTSQKQSSAIFLPTAVLAEILGRLGLGVLSMEKIKKKSPTKASRAGFKPITLPNTPA